MTARSGRTIAIVALAMAVALVAPACGGDDDVQDGTTTTDAPAATTTSTAPAEMTTAKVYFLRDEKVAPIGRDVDAASPARGAMEALVAGPSDGEGGLVSSIPVGTSVLGVNIVDNLATVDLSSEFGSGGGSASMITRVAQVVYTLTQFPTVGSVAFRIDGEPVEAIGGEGVIVDPPRTRADYEDQTPAILVESPLPDTQLTSPFTATGTGNTFEATYSYSLTDSAGTVVADGFGTATSGTGTRGTFSQEIAFSNAAPGPAVLKFYESSAKDGSETNVVEIPVEL